jgi:hypothetical protein
VKIGDILHLEPTLEATSGLGTSTLASITARVIYIHPAGRYYTVEFRSPITGYNWREAFWPELAPLFKAAAMRSEDQTKGER